MKKIAIVFAFLLLMPALSFAQGLGSIVGTVTDPSGAAVASAKISAVDSGTGISREATTDARGYYVIPSLKPAEYTVNIHAGGFRPAKQSVTLLADQTLTVNLALQVGASSEVIEVTGNQLQVDTSTQTLQQVVEQRRISELPLNGRNAAQLTLLTAGAVNSPNGGADQGFTKTFPGGLTISANGARQNMVSYRLDGGNYVDEYTNVNQPFPFPDALQEFSVQTSNYSAEYGQNAGAVVNVITRSGTNNFHGDLFEFVRNSVFNARNYFAPQTTKFNGATVPTKDNGRDQIKRNQFGGTFGGPIVRNKTFFFGGVQITRFRNTGNPSNATIPTTALTPGSIPANGPVTSSCPTCDVETYLNNGGTINPVSLNILNAIPLGTNPSLTYLKPDNENFKEFLGRVDHAFSDNDRLSVRYTYNQFHRDPVFDAANLLAYADGSTITNQNYLIHETHVFRPTLLNDFRFSFARENAGRGPAANVPSIKTLGSNIPFQPSGNAIQQVRVNGFFNFGDNPQATFIRNNFTWSDDVSWVKGKHDIRMGGIIERSRVDLNNLFFQPGEFSLPSLNAFFAGQLGDYSGNFAFRQGAGEFKNNRNIFAGIYVQDNIRLTRRLTVDLGLRYEPALPWREIKGRVQQFRLAGLLAGTVSTQFPNAPPGVFFPGDPGVPPYGVNATLNNFAPRVGFAWDIFGDGKTALRGGAGMFFDTRLNGIINNRFVDQTPFSPQLILSTNVGTVSSNPGTLSDPLCTQAATQSLQNCVPQTNLFPAPFPPPSNSTFAAPGLYLSWDPNHKYQVPTVYNFNLAVERQLPSNMLARLAFVGSRSNHLTETLALNPAPFDPNGVKGPLRLNTIAANQGLPNNLFAQVQQDMQDVDANYSSLQASIEKRMSHGLTILANYTYSKSLDDLPPSAGVTGFDNSSARPWDDPLRHAFDYGPSDFDHTHRFVASYVWSLPTLASTNGFVHNVVGGWQLGGVVSAQTGRPLTVLEGKELSGTGLGQDRGILIAGADPYASGVCAGSTTSCVDWLNPAAFASQSAGLGTYGNTGKGAFRLPGFYSWDMNLSKEFSFTERWRLQFRAEFFNVFNRANFMEDTSTSSSPASLTNFQKVSAGAFGKILQASDPRIGQLALKLFF